MRVRIRGTKIFVLMAAIALGHDEQAGLNGGKSEPHLVTPAALPGCLTYV